ncbi:MAG TPA: DeoR/GlpR family DNA-binding transcription regulator [Ktedonobacteraceae bacterium]|jgi:DeoR/GlpR family transcriptional regulator of sugar metabolism|nr:DeoR/GlpR family DNA-binding transcription regulator [Ktedonobacteraceae bacterium]
MQLNTERLLQIEHLIQERQHVRVTELSERFGVSEPTIRRDLQKLETMGRIQRAHGGASAMEQALPEPPIGQRSTEYIDEKRHIGYATARLIQDGETIFLGSGTTTLEVARNLYGKKDLTVITNAINIAHYLASNTDINVIITGGVLRHSALSMIGYIVEQTLKELRADKAIVSMRAISVDDGLTNDNLLETMTDRKIIQLAREVILVADHTKFGKVSTAVVAPITAVHKVVTDEQTPDETIQRLREMSITVLQV